MTTSQNIFEFYRLKSTSFSLKRTPVNLKRTPVNLKRSLRLSCLQLAFNIILILLAGLGGIVVSSIACHAGILGSISLGAHTGIKDVLFMFTCFTS